MVFKFLHRIVSNTEERNQENSVNRVKISILKRVRLWIIWCMSIKLPGKEYQLKSFYLHIKSKLTLILGI